MKPQHLLPLALATLLIGCGEPSPDEALNATLPKVGLDQLLPQATPNQYCTTQLDSELLFGLGYQLYDHDQPELARSCLIMAAPSYDRALCYLAKIAEQDSTKDSAERDREAFGYLAYSARKNDSCAEFGMFQNFTFGMRGQTPDTALGLRWLERSARHGDTDAQQTLVRLHTNKGNLALAYSWARALDDQQKIQGLKQKMSAQQLGEGEQEYQRLSPQLTSQDSVRQQNREQNIALYTAGVYQLRPTAFEGMPAAERHVFMDRALSRVSALPAFTNRLQLYTYAIIARQAQLRDPQLDILQNPQVLALLQNPDLDLEPTVTQALAILAPSGS